MSLVVDLRRVIPVNGQVLRRRKNDGDRRPHRHRGRYPFGAHSLASSLGVRSRVGRRRSSPPPRPSPPRYRHRLRRRRGIRHAGGLPGHGAACHDRGRNHGRRSRPLLCSIADGPSSSSVDPHGQLAQHVFVDCICRSSITAAAGASMLRKGIMALAVLLDLVGEVQAPVFALGDISAIGGDDAGEQLVRAST